MLLVDANEDSYDSQTPMMRENHIRCSDYNDEITMFGHLKNNTFVCIKILMPGVKLRTKLLTIFMLW